MQVLRRGDTVAIVDGDHVEDRNLARQNFRARDIGVNKAEVMAARYRRDGVTVEAYASMLTEANAEPIVAGTTGNPVGRILLGCVDNWRARRLMDTTTRAAVSRLWIDGGNERRGGQVLLSATAWPCTVKGPYARSASGMYEAPGLWTLPGLQTAMPQLLEAQSWHCHRCKVDNDGTRETCKKCKQPEDSCRDRIDLQTVAVNQMSATCIMNALANVLYQVPFSCAGAFFSTLNTMSPIKLETVNWDRWHVLPETTYAGTSAAE
jgi:molybdopterin/thiamine biosynthesis adenylyltransferase